MNFSKNYNVIPTEKFKRQTRKLVKKYPSLIQDLSGLSKLLETNPQIGVSLGNNCFKVRIAIKSKGHGKRSGARIITYLIHEELEVFLLAIYDKSDISSITDKQISLIIKKIKE
jgi:mRNA-degrading endonuclease RelE of RelBE toxin-antitoxin system